jgi:hypothetical protein
MPKNLNRRSRCKTKNKYSPEFKGDIRERVRDLVLQGAARPNPKDYHDFLDEHKVEVM